MQLQLFDKVALINGAGSKGGIAEACAKVLAEEGVRLVVTDIATDGIQALSHKLAEVTPHVLALPADQTKQNDVERVVSAASDTYGGIDILINCAALTNNLGSVVSMGPERWRREIDVSLTGPYMWCHEVIPLMRQRSWGRILNISSTNAITGQRGVPAYVAAKGGLNSLTKQIALEQASRGINCNALILGPISTGIYDRSDFDQETVKRMVSRVPLGRMGTTEEVANLAAFVCSPLASYLTGALITLDGGLTLAY